MRELENTAFEQTQELCLRLACEGNELRAQRRRKASERKARNPPEHIPKLRLRGACVVRRITSAAKAQNART
tara:strand:- start:41506 stop:41721 length:216 start_codon:yes stop_codon:yes gene_type:complete